LHVRCTKGKKYWQLARQTTLCFWLDAAASWRSTKRHTGSGAENRGTASADYWATRSAVDRRLEGTATRAMNVLIPTVVLKFDTAGAKCRYICQPRETMFGAQALRGLGLIDGSRCGWSTRGIQSLPSGHSPLQQATFFSAHTPGRNNWPLRVATTTKARTRRSLAPIQAGTRRHSAQRPLAWSVSPQLCSSSARTPLESIHCCANGHPDRLDFSSLILHHRCANHRRCC
jgi:hypothetical protein